MVEKTTESIFSYLENSLVTIQNILMHFSNYEPLDYLNGSSKDVTFHSCGNTEDGDYENIFFEHKNMIVIQQKNNTQPFDEDLFETIFTKVALQIKG